MLHAQKIETYAIAIPRINAYLDVKYKITKKLSDARVLETLEEAQRVLQTAIDSDIVGKAAVRIAKITTVVYVEELV